MSKKPAEKSDGSYDGNAPQSELAALLLEVLRKVDRDTRALPDLTLGPAAQAAVDHYREIALDLATRPENSINNGASFTPSGA